MKPAELKERIYYKIAVEGLNQQEILGSAEKEKWEARPDAIKKAIGEIEERLAAESQKIDLDAQEGLRFLRLNLIYQKSMKVQDYKTALQAETKLMQLCEKVEKRKRGKAPNQGKGILIPIRA